MIENLADDKQIVSRALDFIDIYKKVSGDRMALESRWEQYWNIWKVYIDTRYYAGTSNIYLPVVRKNTEEGINNITAKLFPTDDFLNARAMPGTPDEFANAVKTLLTYQLSEEMVLPLTIKPVLREMLVPGTAVAKVWFDGRKRCPQLREMSLKDDFYIYPATVRDVDDAMVTFERMRIDRYELERMAELGKYKNIDELPKTGSLEDDKPRKGLVNEQQDSYDKLPLYDLVEAWCELELKKGERKSVVITFSPSERKILQITPSPLKYKEQGGDISHFKPYVSMPLIRQPKSFYGPSIYEVAQRLQYAVNDCANMVLDNGILIQNPIVLVDTALVNNPAALVFKPRARWDCPPGAIDFARPPDVLANGLALINQLKFVTEEFSNIGGMTPMTTKRTTATEIATFNQMMGTFISSTVADIENGLTLPIAKKTWWLDQIYMKPEDVRRILGIQGFVMQMPKKSGVILKKDFMFRWLGSTQSMNIHIKSQQAINYIGMAGSVYAGLPPQEQQKFSLGWTYLFKEAWRNLGHADVDKVVIETGNMQSLDPKQENEIMLNGKEVDIHKQDEDMAHIMAHNLASQEVDDEAIAGLFASHVMKHLEQARAKYQAQIQMQAMMQNGIPPAMPGQNSPTGNPGQPQIPKVRGGQMAQPPRTTQASTMGQVVSTTMGGGAPRPPKQNPVPELRQ